jgi:hypothetical protein
MLPSLSDSFNAYYAYEHDNQLHRVEKLKHYTRREIKQLVAALEKSGLPNAIDAAVQILELGTSTKNKLFESIQTIKKRYKKDDRNHDFRMMGDDVYCRSSWMLSYWVGPDLPEVLNDFEDITTRQFQNEKPDEYFAILDTGKDMFKFKRVNWVSKQNEDA